MERLKRRTDFRAIAQAGARAPAKAFVLQALRRDEQGKEPGKDFGNDPGKDPGMIRVGFTVSRQVGNAVERNRVRRRLREMVRRKSAAAFAAGHDYVLIGRRSALTCPFDDMVRELDGALRRIATDARKATGGRNKPLLHRAGPEHGNTRPNGNKRRGGRPGATATSAKEH